MKKAYIYDYSPYGRTDNDFQQTAMIWKNVLDDLRPDKPFQGKDENDAEFRRKYKKYEKDRIEFIKLYSDNKKTNHLPNSGFEKLLSKIVCNNIVICSSVSSLSNNIEQFFERYNRLKQKKVSLCMPGIHFHFNRQPSTCLDEENGVILLADALSKLYTQKIGHPKLHESQVLKNVKRDYENYQKYNIPINIKALSEECQVSRSTIYRHLKKLDPDYCNSEHTRIRRTKSEIEDPSTTPIILPGIGNQFTLEFFLAEDPDDV